MGSLFEFFARQPQVLDVAVRLAAQAVLDLLQVAHHLAEARVGGAQSRLPQSLFFFVP